MITTLLISLDAIIIGIQMLQISVFSAALRGLNNRIDHLPCEFGGKCNFDEQP